MTQKGLRHRRGPFCVGVCKSWLLDISLLRFKSKMSYVFEAVFVIKVRRANFS
jgi:hypothetical protein